jgi:hypothetical protein
VAMRDRDAQANDNGGSRLHDWIQINLVSNCQKTFQRPASSKAFLRIYSFQTFLAFGVFIFLLRPWAMSILLSSRFDAPIKAFSTLLF